jgi:hypothetical protein
MENWEKAIILERRREFGWNRIYESGIKISGQTLKRASRPYPTRQGPHSEDAT